MSRRSPDSGPHFVALLVPLIGSQPVLAELLGAATATWRVLGAEEFEESKVRVESEKPKEKEVGSSKALPDERGLLRSL